MSLSRTAALLLLALQALPALAEGGRPLASVSMAPSAEPPPAPVVELLPPGIRRPSSGAGPVWSSRDAPYGPRVVELVEDSSPEAAGWLQVEYTVDPRLDARIRQVLAGGGVQLGHVIVMDPASGEVFSYVSTDPVAFPATRPYPSASLMKVVTAAAVLRNAPDAATHSCRYLGSPYEVRAEWLEPPKRGGQLNSFLRAISTSNNQCFARFAVRDVGEERLLREMERVGLLEPPAVGHSPGRVEPIEEPLDLGYLGSGLAGSFITPLAAARMAAVLAEGDLVRPFWIAHVRDARGRPRAMPRPQPRHVWSPEVADELREMMVSVTLDGTARRAFSHGHALDGIRVAGKTGTLNGTNPDGTYQWFAGVAPADAPRIAIATLVVNAPPWWNTASEVAAKSLREIFCTADGCDAARAERLHARARARDEAFAAELAEEARLYETAELDRPPRPMGVAKVELPDRLLRKRARGKIVLLVELDPKGRVQEVEVESSTLPDFEEFVTGEVAGWTFTPPLLHGRPVRARARLPIPIAVE
jgi:hypothetical protein